MSLLQQAADIRLPTATISDTVPTSAANTGGLDLTSYIGDYVWLRCTASVAIKAMGTYATASAATSADMPISADTDYSFYVTPETQYLSLLGLGTTGTVYVARSSGRNP